VTPWLARQKIKDVMASLSELVEEMVAPRGRPPAGYQYVAGMYVHLETGNPFDIGRHAVLVHAKKLACLKAHYWQRGGRSKRLQRYVEKRGWRQKQLTLAEATAQLAETAATTHTAELTALVINHLEQPGSESHISYTCPRPIFELTQGISSQPSLAT